VLNDQPTVTTRSCRVGRNSPIELASIEGIEGQRGCRRERVAPSLEPGGVINGSNPFVRSGNHRDLCLAGREVVRKANHDVMRIWYGDPELVRVHHSCRIAHPVRSRPMDGAPPGPRSRDLPRAFVPRPQTTPPVELRADSPDPTGADGDHSGRARRSRKPGLCWLRVSVPQRLTD
jgi:hypothetical protein